MGERDLTGRKARCSYCRSEKPSDQELPFFEYRGPGSDKATTICKCGYHKVAHTPEKRNGRNPIACDDFSLRGPAEFDLYYCGCRGWE